jgi:hypothetical protein
MGMLSSGHYTAAVLNHQDQQWYLMNDESCRKLSDAHQVVTNNAYLLFYRRRNMPMPLDFPAAPEPQLDHVEQQESVAAAAIAALPSVQSGIDACHSYLNMDMMNRLNNEQFYHEQQYKNRNPSGYNSGDENDRYRGSSMHSGNGIGSDDRGQWRRSGRKRPYEDPMLYHNEHEHEHDELNSVCDASNIVLASTRPVANFMCHVCSCEFMLQDEYEVHMLCNHPEQYT